MVSTNRTIIAGEYRLPKGIDITNDDRIFDSIISCSETNKAKLVLLGDIESNVVILCLMNKCLKLVKLFDFNHSSKLKEVLLLSGEGGGGGGGGGIFSSLLLSSSSGPPRVGVPSIVSYVALDTGRAVAMIEMLQNFVRFSRNCSKHVQLRLRNA